MILFIIFFILFLVFVRLYFTNSQRFTLDNLFLGLWSIAIAVAQLRLSPYEKSWPIEFWLILLIFFGVFLLVKIYLDRLFSKRAPEREFDWQFLGRPFNVILILMTAVSLAANFYIFNRFGTLPILSSLPDKMRFIINREVFGLWEYLALLPRIFIPLSFIYLILVKTQKRWLKILVAVNIILGFLILGLYASRVTIIFAVFLCYFSYLIVKIRQINYKKIISASVITVIIVLVAAVSIPALRQYITYRDYYTDIEYTPFTYLADLSEVRIPQKFNFLIPLYLIPSFNLQALMRSTDYFGFWGNYWGRYSLSVFDPLLNILRLPQFDIYIPWKEMFLPWWVTATFLFNYWVDFGIIGIILAAVFWAVILSGIYFSAIKKPTFLSVMLFAYFSFVVIMTIYTNYFSRPEFYLDLAVIIAVHWLLNIKKSNNI